MRTNATHIQFSFVCFPFHVTFTPFFPFFVFFFFRFHFLCSIHSLHFHSFVFAICLVCYVMFVSCRTWVKLFDEFEFWMVCLPQHCRSAYTYYYTKWLDAIYAFFSSPFISRMVLIFIRPFVSTFLSSPHCSKSMPSLHHIIWIVICIKCIFAEIESNITPETIHFAISMWEMNRLNVRTYAFNLDKTFVSHVYCTVYV